MALIVTGYVDGEPVYYEEQTPDEYSATADAEVKAQYDVQVLAEDDYGNVGVLSSMVYMEDTWLEPIWQRTEEDMTRLKYLNNKARLNGFSSLSTAEQAEWGNRLIAAINYWDWNRIEQNTKYLSGALNDYGYTNSIELYQVATKDICDSEGNIVDTIAEHVTWIKEDMPYTEELDRIRNNMQILINCFYAQAVALPVDIHKPTIAKINAFEQVQKLMKEMLGLMSQSFVYSGTVYSDQEVVL